MVDDFLHNLRTNKQRFDRNRKPYDGKYPGTDRQRNKDSVDVNSFVKIIASEQLPAFNKIMEGIADSQKRMADAAERRAEAEERKAEALEAVTMQLKKIAEKGNRREENLALEALPEKETAPKRKSRAKAKPIQVV
ncbi:MAG: hypothetical protein FP814_07655 [Desulfobacterium sp.]|nr:hypothetical protein [Desulfobacterium sp.]MBU3947206.1 hypothetical protein [Pseudomonadota bacterium]MBU4010813.1 hypothetical protein [Pseudomonadota bacterium]